MAVKDWKPALLCLWAAEVLRFDNARLLNNNVKRSCSLVIAYSPLIHVIITMLKIQCGHCDCGTLTPAVSVRQLK